MEGKKGEDEEMARENAVATHKDRKTKIGASPLEVLLGAESAVEGRRSVLSESGLRVQHPSLNAKMRTIVVSWLMEVSAEYTLGVKTCHLAIELFDAYLAVSRDVVRNQLQLFGVAALFMASKLEEIYAPTSVDFVEMTDGAYSEQDLHLAERSMLITLNWDLHPPTLPEFVGVYLSILQAAALERGIESRFLTCPHAAWRSGMALVDAVVLDVATRDAFSNSEIAAACVFLLAGTNAFPDVAAVLGIVDMDHLVAAAEHIVAYTDEAVLHDIESGSALFSTGTCTWMDDPLPETLVQAFSPSSLQRVLDIQTLRRKVQKAAAAAKAMAAHHEGREQGLDLKAISQSIDPALPPPTPPSTS